jgi:dolichol-phosphate mannosyltransferase
MEASGSKRIHGTDSATAALPSSGTAAGLSISLVLPVASVEQNVAALVRSTDEALSRLTSDYEILLVTDGNQHAAELATLTAAKPSTLRILHASHPLGYGEALRTGLRAATKSYVGIVAADTELAPQDVSWLA